MYNKLSLTTVLCFLFAGVSFSQTVSVSADKMNVFYIGVDNPVTITASNASCKDLVIKISNGQISGSNCNYVVRSDTVGTCRITVSSKDPAKKGWSSTSSFRVKMLPKPVFRVGPYGGCYFTASKLVLQAQQYVRSELWYVDIDIRIKVDSFRLRILRDSVETFSLINRGNKISDEIHNAFNTLTKGDIIVFDQVMISSPYLSPSLKGYYESDSYDEYGNKIYKRNEDGNDQYFKLTLEPLVLRIYE